MPQAEEPLLKITLNLFAHDVAELKRWYGFGYTQHIRDIVRKEIRTMQRRMNEDPYD